MASKVSDRGYVVVCEVHSYIVWSDVVHSQKSFLVLSWTNSRKKLLASVFVSSILIFIFSAFESQPFLSTVIVVWLHKPSVGLNVDVSVLAVSVLDVVMLEVVVPDVTRF